MLITLSLFSWIFLNKKLFLFFLRTYFLSINWSVFLYDNIYASAFYYLFFDIEEYFLFYLQIFFFYDNWVPFKSFQFFSIYFSFFRIRLNATTVELELISVQQLSGVPYLGENFNDKKPVNRLPHTKKMSIVKCTLALLLAISTHLNA